VARRRTACCQLLPAPLEREHGRGARCSISARTTTRRLGGVNPTCQDRGFDEVGNRELPQARVAGPRRSPRERAQALERLSRPTQPEIEQSEGVRGLGGRQPEAECGRSLERFLRVRPAFVLAPLDRREAREERQKIGRRHRLAGIAEDAQAFRRVGGGSAYRPDQLRSCQHLEGDRRCEPSWPWVR
jgi:hypothetical protein